MMKIQRFVCNMLQENCYLVSDDTLECIIIDNGMWYPEEHKAMKQYVESNGLMPTRLLATHGHLDHNMGNNITFQAYGLRPEVAKADAFLINNLPLQAENMFGMELPCDYPQATDFLADKDIIRFGKHQLEVIATPGHSPGSICFYEPNEKVLFSGDTLFHMSVGRTDLEGGSYMELTKSMKRLTQLPDDVTVLPGHGPQTYIGDEKSYNPYMKF